MTAYYMLSISTVLRVDNTIDNTTFLLDFQYFDAVVGWQEGHSAHKN